MTHLPFIDSTLIEQFVWAQHFRHPATRKNYAGILRNFSDFLANHDVVASPNPLCQYDLRHLPLII